MRNPTPERSLRFPVQALGGGPHTFFNSPPDNVKGAFVGSMGEVSGCLQNQLFHDSALLGLGTAREVQEATPL